MTITDESGRAVSPAVAPSKLSRAHWCATRLVAHGWQLKAVTRRGFTCTDPAGRARAVHSVTVPQPSLQAHLLGLLAGLHDDDVHHLTAMLQVRHPAGRCWAGDRRAWPIPSVSGTQPSEAVRLAYWLTSTLTDDYGWHVVIEPVNAGFTAAIPTHRRTVRYDQCDRRRLRGTTAGELLDQLAGLNNVELHTLATLVATHCGRPPVDDTGQRR